MIDDLERRAAFWGSREDYNFRGESIEDPYRKHVGIFEGAYVLEIGPGAGRQFLALRGIAKLYAVADISAEVLAKPIYAASRRLHITSYEDVEFASYFDVVHFWYVLHHVKKDELSAFIKFVGGHVRPGGCVYFNTPGDDHPTAQSDDGIGTTLHLLNDIKSNFERCGFVIEDVEKMSYESVCVLARRQ